MPATCPNCSRSSSALRAVFCYELLAARCPACGSVRATFASPGGALVFALALLGVHAATVAALRSSHSIASVTWIGLLGYGAAALAAPLLARLLRSRPGARSAPNHRATAVAVAAIAGAILAMAPIRAAILRSIPGPNAVGRTLGAADWQFRAVALDGSTIDLADLRGRPVFLQFFATWCAPCVRELDSVATLRAAEESAGTSFLLCSDENRGIVAAFAGRKGLDLPFATFDGPRPEPFRSPGVPATFVLDRAGQIVFQSLEERDYAAPEMRDLLRSLR